MRVFLAGATGAIGKPLLATLLSAGHHVTGMTRSAANADALRAQGAEAVVGDALDDSVEFYVRLGLTQIVGSYCVQYATGRS